jgi:hypothetical protein
MCSRVNLRNHLVAGSWHGDDVCRILRTITERLTERGHGLVDRVRCHDETGLDFGQTVIDTNDLTSVPSEAQQCSHRPRL